MTRTERIEIAYLNAGLEVDYSKIPDDIETMPDIKYASLAQEIDVEINKYYEAQRHGERFGQGY